MKRGGIFLAAAFALLLCSCSENGNVEQVAVTEETDYFAVQEDTVYSVNLSAENETVDAPFVFVSANDGAGKTVTADLSCDIRDFFQNDVSLLDYSGNDLFFLKPSDDDKYDNSSEKIRYDLCVYNTADKTVKTAGSFTWNYMSNYASKVMGERYLVFSAENSAGTSVYVYDILQDSFYTADTLPNSSINVYTAQISEHEFAYYYYEAYNSDSHEGYIKIYDFDTRESREIYHCSYGDKVNFMTFDGSELYLAVQDQHDGNVDTAIRKIDLKGNMTGEYVCPLDKSGIGVIRYMKYINGYLYIGGYDVFGDTRGVFFDPENDFAAVSSYDMKLSTPLIMQGGNDIQLFETARNSFHIAAADMEDHRIYYLVPDIESYEDHLSVHAVCSEQGDIVLYMITEDSDDSIGLAFISSENVRKAMGSD